MGIREGAQIASSAARAKEQKAQRLTQEERAKIYMEIAKMNSDINKQRFDMEKESFELQQQANLQNFQMQKMQYEQTLKDMAKQERLSASLAPLMSDMGQFRMAGTDQYNIPQMAGAFLEAGGQYMQPQQRQFWLGQAQGPRVKPPTSPFQLFVQENPGATFNDWIRANKRLKAASRAPKNVTRYELYAKSLGIDPGKIRSGTYTAEEAMAIRQAIQADGNAMLALMFGHFSGQTVETPQPEDELDTILSGNE